MERPLILRCLAPPQRASGRAALLLRRRLRALPGRAIRALALLAALGLAGPSLTAAAGEEAEVGRPAAGEEAGSLLPLEEVLERALAGSRALREAELAVEAAGERCGQARSRMRPAIELGAAAARYAGLQAYAVQFPGAPEAVELFPRIENRYLLSLALSQPLYAGGLFRSRLEGALAEGERAQRLSEASRADLVFEVTRTYWDWSRALASTQAVEAGQRRLAAHLEDVNNLLEAGMATRNDLLAAEVRLERLAALRVESEGRAETTRSRMEFLIGSPLEAGRRPQAPAGEPSWTAPELESLVEEALAARPEVAAARQGVEAALQGVRARRSENRPQLALQAHADLARPNGLIVPPEDRWNDTYWIGLALGWPVWEGGAAAYRVAEARTAVEQAENARRLIEDRVRLEVTTARLEAVTAWAMIEVAARAQAKALENLEVARDRYREGMALHSEVLDAESGLTEAQLEGVGAAAAWRGAAAALERAAGRRSWAER